MLNRNALILIIDDDSESLRMLALTLSIEGFRVMTSDRGEHALELIERFPFCAVITDLRMPLMDGFDLVRKARIIRPEMHFIVGSRQITPANEAECRDVFVSHFLSKPYNVEEVSSILHSFSNQEESAV